MNSKKITFITLIGSLYLVACGESPLGTVVAKQGFAVASESNQFIAAMKTVGTCSLENIVTIANNSTNFGTKNNYSVKKNIAYKLIGFATNTELSAVPKSIRMMLVGSQTYSLNGTTGLDRPDVAAFFKSPSLTTAGYQIDAEFNNVKPGEYVIFILLTDAAAPIACPTHQTVTVN